MLADLQQGVPWGAEGQEFSKTLLGEEERAPGFWCCSIQGRKARDFYDTLKTETQQMYVISRHVYTFSYFLVYIYMSYMLIYLLIYILRSCIQLMSECVWCWACTQLALDCHLHRNDQSGATLIL